MNPIIPPVNHTARFSGQRNEVVAGSATNKDAPKKQAPKYTLSSDPAVDGASSQDSSSRYPLARLNYYDKANGKDEGKRRDNDRRKKNIKPLLDSRCGADRRLANKKHSISIKV